jgi:hypothetical protein
MPGDEDMSQAGTDISVIVAAEGRPEGLDAAVRLILRSCEGLRSEVLVVRPAGRPVPPLPPGARLLTGEGADLVPHLWARGMAEARGGAVALTTANVRVGPAWARALLAGLARNAAGVGGPIRLAPGTGAVGRAAYFLRYGAFMADRGSPQPPEIAGDNAAYNRVDLLRHASTFQDGFWEVEFHRLMRAEGRPLAFSPDAAVEIGDAFGLGEFLRQRFRHGTRSGRYLTAVLGIPAWRSLLATPLVPFVLAARILRHARRVPGALPLAVRAIPLILPMAAAWALGEAAGALGAGRAA